jgi:excinuclease ABC subunit C
MVTELNKKKGRKDTRQKALSAEYLNTVPRQPGVYLMKDQQDRVLYVGKAKDLRKRLSSYQRVGAETSPKTVLLLNRITAIDTILTHNEKEALILEASLIKKHRPKFNVDLKDDKSYPRIKVTLSEEWPRVYMTRRRLNDGSRYFGPYSSAGAMHNTLKLISMMFPLRRCKGRKLKRRSRPCLNFQMGRCLAPCSELVDKKQYRRMVDSVMLVLEGKNKQVRKLLTNEMSRASRTMDYERAAVIRDQLQALDKTLEKQIVISNRDKDQDVFGCVRKGAGVGIAVIKMRQGVVLGKLEYFLLDPIGDNGEVLGEVLRQYYSREVTIPDQIWLPFKTAGHSALSGWLTEARGRVVQLQTPKRGKKIQLLQMAEKNAKQILTDVEKKKKSWQEMSRNLQSRLKLKRYPSRIECLDISNIGGKHPVGALVCFLEGEKTPKEYRHYSITSAHEPDDYRMMTEVLTRRFDKTKREKALPDLLLVDGGKGHLNAAFGILCSSGLQDLVELAAIAKDKEGKADKIYRPGRKNPINLQHYSPVLFFLMQVRDEAHRFGIAFHRRLRHKRTLSSELDVIPGVGPSRKKELLKKLGSLAAVKKATVEELETVPGIGSEMALHLWKHFNT